MRTTLAMILAGLLAAGVWVLIEPAPKGLPAAGVEAIDAKPQIQESPARGAAAPSGESAPSRGRLFPSRAAHRAP